MQESLTCKRCGSTLFEQLRVGRFQANQEWLDRELPLPKEQVNEWSLGGGCVYRCFECGAYANGPKEYAGTFLKNYKISKKKK